MNTASINDLEFRHIQGMLYRHAGIYLAPAKKQLVCGRLGKRLNLHQVGSFTEYLRLLESGRAPEEWQTAVDLLTTNETYFFREPKHFDFISRRILPAHPSSTVFRVWSAACSSGEEPYSLAMLLASKPGSRWEILASDICTQVLEKARAGHYPLERTTHVPPDYLGKYCRKGIGSQQGTLLVERGLRERVRFVQINLSQTLPDIGQFDVIFLRNVMIYFDKSVRQQVVARLAQRLKPGGHLMIGHSESLHGVCDSLEQVAPAIYRKP